MVPKELMGKKKFWGAFIDDDNRLWIEKWQLLEGNNKKLTYETVDEIVYLKQDDDARWYLEDVESEPFGKVEEDLSLDTMVDQLVDSDMVYALTLEELLEELKEKVLHDYLMTSRHLDQLGVIEYYIEEKMKGIGDEK